MCGWGPGSLPPSAGTAADPAPYRTRLLTATATTPLPIRSAPRDEAVPSLLSPIMSFAAIDTPDSPDSLASGCVAAVSNRHSVRPVAVRSQHCLPR